MANIYKNAQFDLTTTNEQMFILYPQTQELLYKIYNANIVVETELEVLYMIIQLQQQFNLLTYVIAARILKSDI